MIESTNELNHDIQEKLKAITQGASKAILDRSRMITNGIGTARMINGWVSKIHDNPADEEFKYYGGTVDVTEFYDEKYTAEPIVYKGVKLSNKIDKKGGFLIIPHLHSDVTIMIDAGSSDKHIVDFTHASIIKVESNSEVTVGVYETEELDLDDEDAPDYDELEKTHNDAYTTYTPSKIVTVVKNKDGDIYEKITTPKGYEESVGDVRFEVKSDGVLIKHSDMSIDVNDSSITLGSGKNVEPVVRGNNLAMLLKDVLIECAGIKTPTLMGTMPTINFANFTNLITRIDSILSDTVFIKQ